jgi:hypothetical protein
MSGLPRFAVIPWRPPIVVAAAATLVSCGGGAGSGVAAVDRQSETSGVGLQLATVSGDGLMALTSTSGVFHFGVQARVDEVVPGQEYDVSKEADWKLLFTALVPDGDGSPVEQTTGADCKPVEQPNGEVNEVCEIPYFGYGTDEPRDVVVEAGAKDAMALVYFHEFGHGPGDRVVMDYFLMAAVQTPDGGCSLFYDFSHVPLEFVVGEELKFDLETAGFLGMAASGPVLSVDTVSEICGDKQCPVEDCGLWLFPVPFVDFCPLPSVQTTAAGPAVSHWYARCTQELPGLADYPTL